MTTLVIGVGNMGGAIVDGWVTQGKISPSDLLIIDRSPKPLTKQLVEDGAVLSPTPDDIATADTVLLAVKPQTWQDGVDTYAPHMAKDATIISVMAGVTYAQLRTKFPTQSLVRVMPNTPTRIGKGITLIAKHPDQQPGVIDAVEHLLTPLGSTYVLPDEQALNTATTLSGCGPAYIFYLAEALAAAGIRKGIGPAIALPMAIDTVTGAASLMESTDTPPNDLSNQVASKGGMTAMALNVFKDDDALINLIETAMTAAEKRGEELETSD